MNTPTIIPPVDPVRVRIFVDFWNFTLAVRNLDPTLQVDWRKLGPVLAAEAGRLIDATRPALYEGLHVYGSFDPAKSNDAKLRNWFTNTLDKMPGVNVVLLERQRKRGYPRCPKCQTGDKGVDRACALLDGEGRIIPAREILAEAHHLRRQRARVRRPRRTHRTRSAGCAYDVIARTLALMRVCAFFSAASDAGVESAA